MGLAAAAALASTLVLSAAALAAAAATDGDGTGEGFVSSLEAAVGYDNSALDNYLFVLDDEFVVAQASASDPSLLPSLNGTDLGWRLPPAEDGGQPVKLPDVADHPKRYRWVHNCSSLWDNLHFEHPRVIGSLIPLGVICLVIIFGNFLVIMAVRVTTKLRGTTNNLFISSMAVADFTVGLVVVPSSATYEVFGFWLFGKVWCQIWLAVDVWSCTTSILHLMIISLDRYLAVTKPIQYPNMMTSKRAKLLVLGAWVVSLCICLPPLVGFDFSFGGGDDGTAAAPGAAGNVTLDYFYGEGLSDYDEDAASAPGVLHSSRPALEDIEERCFPKCELHNSRGYVIYSAVGSFYLPTLVMMFFNYRIYRTATNTTRAINQGFTKVKGSEGGLASMGIHRGGGGGGSTAMALANSAASTLTVHNTPRKDSASLRGGAYSVASSRRPSGSCLAVNGTGAAAAALRRQQTIATNEHHSRTLPRSSAASLATGGRVTSNGRVATGARGSVVSTTNLALSHRRGSTSDNNLQLLSPHMTPGGSNGRRRHSRQNHLSASTNSLHVPGSRESEPQPRMHHSTSAYSGFRKFRRGPGDDVAGDAEENVKLLPLKSNGNGTQPQQQRPHMSHHQPCPNHVGGRTFAEQGTQTLKDDRLRAASAAAAAALAAQQQSSRNGKAKRGGSKKEGKHIFRWRSGRAGQQQPDGKTAPPPPGINVTVDGAGGHVVAHRSDSLTNLALRHGHGGDRRRRLSWHSCFRFHRWKAFATTRCSGSSNRHSANSGSSGVDSAAGGGVEAMVGGGGGVTSGGPSAAASHSDLSNVRLNGSDSHAKGFGKRNIRGQVRRFRMETKAAKTLGIIVGCFICCWFPFFTIYLIGAFCEDCIPPTLFSVMFWLGYCNSAINPFIYAMFSRDFRNAFKKILCKVLCRDQPDPYAHVGALARMGLPFAPQSVAVGLSDRFATAGSLPQPGQPPPSTGGTGGAVSASAAAAGAVSVSAGDANSSSASSGRHQRDGKNAIYA